MAEKDSAEWPEELGPEEQTPKVRVNDRRRIRLGDEAEGGAPEESGAADAPSLKPSYVEELEGRARAAEQKAADVQARFEQVRAELKRETDELRQRLARNAEERVTRLSSARTCSKRV